MDHIIFSNILNRTKYLNTSTRFFNDVCGETKSIILTHQMGLSSVMINYSGVNFSSTSDYLLIINQSYDMSNTTMIEFIYKLGLLKSHTKQLCKFGVLRYYTTIYGHFFTLKTNQTYFSKKTFYADLKSLFKLTKSKNLYNITENKYSKINFNVVQSKFGVYASKSFLELCGFDISHHNFEDVYINLELIHGYSTKKYCLELLKPERVYVCSKSFRKSTYHNKINEWTILHSFKVANTKKQINVKNHITKVAWSGEDIFNLTLLDQDFKIINKDLISSCHINMSITPLPIERLKSSLQLVYRFEESKAKKKINFNVLLHNNISLDGNSTVAITGLSIPKIYNVQPKYSRFTISSHTNLDNIHVQNDINLMKSNSSVLEITKGYYSNIKLLCRQLNKLISKFNLTVELLGGLVKLLNNSDRNIIIEFEPEICGLLGFNYSNVESNFIKLPQKSSIMGSNLPDIDYSIPSVLTLSSSLVFNNYTSVNRVSRQLRSFFVNNNLNFKEYIFENIQVMKAAPGIHQQLEFCITGSTDLVFKAGSEIFLELSLG